MSAMKKIFSDIAECHENGVDIKNFDALIQALAGTASGSYISASYNCQSWRAEAENILTLMGMGDRVLDLALSGMEERMVGCLRDAELVIRFFQSTNPAAALAFLKMKEELEINAKFLKEIRALYKG